MPFSLSPPLCSPATVDAHIREHGHAVLDADGLGALLGESPLALEALTPFWDDLPPDLHLRDGGRYRRRRHACFVVDGPHVTLAPHRAHFQPLEYNALHGGIARWFSPMAPAMLALPIWTRLLTVLGERATAARGARPWYVEAHPFRIDTTDGIGRPTPEGAHRDGVDLIAIMLIGRKHVKGGETRVFDAQGPRGLRFTMAEPFTTLLLDDARVIHETTPIQPTGDEAHRDTLVLTFRADNFQGA
jgi:hypothetical protein